MPEIEFVDADGDPGYDEELPSAARRERSPRARRALAVLAVLAVAALLISRLADREADGPPTAHASSSPSPRSVPVPAPTSQLSLSFALTSLPVLSVRHDTDTVIPVRIVPEPGPACSARDVCRTTDAVPGPVLQALRARYPGITVDSATSVLSGPSKRQLEMRTRTVLAHTSAETVIVDIRPMVATDSTQVSSGGSGAGVSVVVTVADLGWTVTVTVRNPRSLDADTATPSALATDGRLLTTS